jgi:hypothetical protein
VPVRGGLRRTWVRKDLGRDRFERVVESVGGVRGRLVEGA